MPVADIVALVRSPAKAADLGVAAREADYHRAETLDRALAGVDTLLLVSANEVGMRLAKHPNVIRAAKRAGVGRVVYTSLLHADVSPLSRRGPPPRSDGSLSLVTGRVKATIVPGRMWDDALNGHGDPK